jgi:hypothetical protein
MGTELVPETSKHHTLKRLFDREVFIELWEKFQEYMWKSLAFLSRNSSLLSQYLFWIIFLHYISSCLEVIFLLNQEVCLFSRYLWRNKNTSKWSRFHSRT